MTWVRVDGKPPTVEFEVDNVICRGEMQKAGLTAPAPQGAASAYRQGQAVGEVYNGCMAGRGWMLQPVN
jgi:hypothetical protein